MDSFEKLMATMLEKQQAAKPTVPSYEEAVQKAKDVLVKVHNTITENGDDIFEGNVQFVEHVKNDQPVCLSIRVNDKSILNLLYSKKNDGRKAIDIDPEDETLEIYELNEKDASDIGRVFEWLALQAKQKKQEESAEEVEDVEESEEPSSEGLQNFLEGLISHASPELCKMLESIKEKASTPDDDKRFEYEAARIVNTILNYDGAKVNNLQYFGHNDVNIFSEDQKSILILTKGPFGTKIGFDVKEGPKALKALNPKYEPEVNRLLKLATERLHNDYSEEKVEKVTAALELLSSIFGLR